MKKVRTDKVLACVPALGNCTTSGDSPADALYQITDAATLMLTVLEDDKTPIPSDTKDFAGCVLGSDIDYVTHIVCDTDFYRSAVLGQNVLADCA